MLIDPLELPVWRRVGLSSRHLIEDQRFFKYISDLREKRLERLYGVNDCDAKLPVQQF